VPLLALAPAPLAPGAASSLFAVGTRQGTIRLFDARSFEPCAVLDAHTSDVLTLDFACDGTRPPSCPLAPRAGHFPARARSCIFIFMEGAPSQVDLFDPKPELTKRHGQPHPLGVEAFTAASNKNVLMASPFRFQRYGQCGMEVSEASVVSRSTAASPTKRAWWLPLVIRGFSPP